MYGLMGSVCFCQMIGWFLMLCSFLLMLPLPKGLLLYLELSGSCMPGRKIFICFISIFLSYSLVLTVEIWGEQMSNQRILFLSDNEATVFVLNKMSSKDPVMMKLVRRLVVAAIRHNIMFHSKHVPGKTNYVADNLSRFQLQEAKQWAPWLDRDQCTLLTAFLHI